MPTKAKSAQSVGARIRAEREASGLSQSDLAARVGVTRQTLASYEQGRTVPGLGTLRRLCDALGLDREEMMDLACVWPIVPQ